MAARLCAFVSSRTGSLSESDRLVGSIGDARAFSLAKSLRQPVPAHTPAVEGNPTIAGKDEAVVLSTRAGNPALKLRFFAARVEGGGSNEGAWSTWIKPI